MPKKILIADDSMLVRRQVSAALKGAGFDIIEAVDGEDAKHKVTPELALVVCDLNMPRMNGMELLEFMRADAKLKGVPFVMLTTEARPGLFERAKELGAKAWLIKPFRPDLLLATISALSTAA